MNLRDFVSLDLVKLELKGETRDEILRELAALPGLDTESEEALFHVFRRRQELGSTGIGRGVAFVYSRSAGMARPCVGFGRKRAGIDFKAMDGNPVHYFFLILAPKVEESNEYLPVLGKLAQFAKDPDVPDRLRRLERPEEFLQLLEEKGF